MNVIPIITSIENLWDDFTLHFPAVPTARSSRCGRHPWWTSMIFCRWFGAPRNCPAATAVSDKCLTRGEKLDRPQKIDNG